MSEMVMKPLLELTPLAAVEDELELADELAHGARQGVVKLQSHGVKAKG